MPLHRLILQHRKTRSMQFVYHSCWRTAFQSEALFRFLINNMLFYKPILLFSSVSVYNHKGCNAVHSLYKCFNSPTGASMKRAPLKEENQISFKSLYANALAPTAQIFLTLSWTVVLIYADYQPMCQQTSEQDSFKV